MSDTTQDKDLSEATSSIREAPRPTYKSRRAADMTRAGRMRENFVFTPNHSTMFREGKITLKTYPIQVAYSMQFERCSFAIWEIEQMIPILSSSEEEAAVFSQALDKILTKYLAHVAKESSYFSAQLENHLNPATTDQYSDIQTLTFRIYSPRMRLYIDAIKQTDDLISLLSDLWWAGLTDNIVNRRNIFNSRMRLINLGRDILTLHQRAYQAIQRRNRADSERIADTKGVSAAERAQLTQQLASREAINANLSGDRLSNADIGERALAAEYPDLTESGERRPSRQARRRGRGAANRAQTDGSIDPIGTEAVTVAPETSNLKIEDKTVSGDTTADDSTTMTPDIADHGA